MLDVNDQRNVLVLTAGQKKTKIEPQAGVFLRALLRGYFNALAHRTKHLGNAVPKHRKTKTKMYEVLLVNVIICVSKVCAHLVRLVGAFVVGVGLYGGDVGVHEDDFDALLLQGLDRLQQPTGHTGI